MFMIYKQVLLLYSGSSKVYKDNNRKPFFYYKISHKTMPIQFTNNLLFYQHAFCMTPPDN